MKGCFGFPDHSRERPVLTFPAVGYGHRKEIGLFTFVAVKEPLKFRHQEAAGGLIGAMRNDYAAWANGFAPLVVANPDRPHLALGFSACLLALRPDIAADVLKTIFLADHRQDARREVLPTQVLQTGHDPAVPLTMRQRH